MKIAINKCYGGFSLSRKAGELLGLKWNDWGCYLPPTIQRNDPKLIQVVEELGEEANGACAEIGIIEIPDDVDWKIEDYDGVEWVSEKHRTWE